MTTPNFKPLLAYTITDTATLDYSRGLYASVKLDGLRCIILDGVVYSRSMKKIRSKAVQRLFGKPQYNGLDGELLYGDWNAPNVFNVSTQVVMSTELKGEFDESQIRLAVFDDVLCNDTYSTRLRDAASKCNGVNVVAVEQRIVKSEQELLEFESKCLDAGFEGVMVRSDSRYKQGRSTAKEGIIGKLKRFQDDEAIVVGYEELLTNTNVKVKNELGYSERSAAKDGLVPAGTLGALVCEYNGMRFNIGSGFSAEQRKQLWEERDTLVGRLVTFKHFECGQIDLPRFPIFKGFRSPEDMN